MPTLREPRNDQEKFGRASEVVHDSIVDYPLSGKDIHTDGQLLYTQ